MTASEVGRTQGPRRGVHYTHIAVTSMTPDDVADADAMADFASRIWAWWLAGGILSILFGVLVLLDLFRGALAVAFLAGLWLLLAGIADLMASSLQRPRWPAVVSGILALGAGVVMIAWPEIGLKAVVVLIGAAFLLFGVAHAVAALVGRGHGWGWHLLAGVVQMVLGLVVLRWPKPTLGVIVVFVGLNAILFGILEVVASMGMRKAKENWARTKAELELG